MLCSCTLCTNLFCWMFLFACLFGTNMKPSWACEHLQPSPQHKSKESVMELLCILNMFHHIYAKSHHIQHLEIHLWHASAFHYQYITLQLTLEADIPWQQFSTDWMSISWMKICCLQKMNQHCMHNMKHILIFAQLSMVLLNDLLMELWPMLIHVYPEEILSFCVTH